MLNCAAVDGVAAELQPVSSAMRTREIRHWGFSVSGIGQAVRTRARRPVVNARRRRCTPGKRAGMIVRDVIDPCGGAPEVEVSLVAIAVIESSVLIALYAITGNDFTKRFASIALALEALPDDTVIDGEVIAYGPDGRRHQHPKEYRGAGPLHLYAFDL